MIGRDGIGYHPLDSIIVAMKKKNKDTITPKDMIIITLISLIKGNKRTTIAIRSSFNRVNRKIIVIQIVLLVLLFGRKQNRIIKVKPTVSAIIT